MALLMGTTALQADVFSFSYSGSGVSVNGTITAASLTPGVYTISDISGIRNGKAFDDSPLGGGSFTYGGPLSSSGTMMFTVGLIGLDTVTFSGRTYAEAGLAGASTGNNFSISQVPEPATLSLLLAMGSGIWILARKLPSRKRN
jgi:hypothetical protein